MWFSVSTFHFAGKNSLKKIFLNTPNDQRIGANIQRPEAATECEKICRKAEGKDAEVVSPEARLRDVSKLSSAQGWKYQTQRQVCWTEREHAETSLGKAP